MGLSKKLGQTPSQQASSMGAQTVAYQWSHQGYTLQDIMRKFKLPCVVQCARESCSLMWSDFHFDLRQPLLLYSLRTVRKLHARSLDTNTLEEFGPPVAIPEDYEGWFACTSKGVNKLKRHTRIQGLVDSNATTFLVCTKCPAFTSHKGPGSCQDFLPHDVMEGEILKRVCVMEGDINDFTAPSVVQRHGPCLECLDDKGEDVIIPLSHRVMTYEIAETFPDSDHKVFNTKSMIASGNKHLPRTISIVHGDPPALSYSYTGLYRCYSVFTEETLLAATLDDPKSICLELATDSCAKFNIGLNNAVLKKTCEYNNAFQACHNTGDKFSTAIKVSFSLKPNVSGLDDIDMSIYENMSSDGVGEVDANSEFEIAWGSGGKSKVKASDYVNLRKVGGDSLPKVDVMGQSELGTFRDLKEANVSSPTETLTANSIRLSSHVKEVDPLLHSESSKGLLPTENLSTAYGEEIVKENPLFVCEESHRHDKECILSLDYDDEDISVISEDFVEISTDEADYSTIVVKKASEYNEDMESSDDTDSDMEDSMQVCDDSCHKNVFETTANSSSDKESMTKECVSRETIGQSNGDTSEPQHTENNGANCINSSKCLNSLEFEPQDDTNSVKGVDSRPQYTVGNGTVGLNSEEGEDSDNCIGDGERECDGKIKEGTTETNVIPKSSSVQDSKNPDVTRNSLPDNKIIKLCSPEDPLAMSLNSGRPLKESFGNETVSVVDRAKDIPQQNQALIDSPAELPPDVTTDRPSLKSGHKEDQHDSSESPSPKMKSTKKPNSKSGHTEDQHHSSESPSPKMKSTRKPNSKEKQKLDSDFSFPFFERLRKFKSGSNVNICSDLQLATDNRFQSSKVRQHPHHHPHRDKKGNVLCVSQDMDLHQRGLTQDTSSCIKGD